MMTEFFYKLEQAPTIDQYLETKVSPILANILTFFLSGLILTTFYLGIPVLFEGNIYLAIFGHFLSLVATFIFTYYMMTRKGEDSVTTTILRRVALGLVLFLMILPLVPIKTEGNESKTMEMDKTYVTYVPDCSFCRASEVPVAIAVNFYNRAHPYDKLQMVNRKGTTPLAKDLYKNTELNGTIIHKGGKPDKINYTKAIYTRNVEGIPATNNIHNIYSKLKRVSNAP